MFGKRRRQKVTDPQILPSTLAPLVDPVTISSVARGPATTNSATTAAPPVMVSTAALAMLVRQRPIESARLERKARTLAKLQAQPSGHSNTLPAVLRPVVEDDPHPPISRPASMPPTGLANTPPWHRLPL